jgi:hypothetical protein
MRPLLLWWLEQIALIKNPALHKAVDDIFYRSRRLFWYWFAVKTCYTVLNNFFYYYMGYFDPTKVFNTTAANEYPSNWWFVGGTMMQPNGVYFSYIVTYNLSKMCMDLFSLCWVVPTLICLLRTAHVFVLQGLWPVLGDATVKAHDKRRLLHHIFHTISLVNEVVNPILGMKLIVYTGNLAIWYAILLVQSSANLGDANEVAIFVCRFNILASGFQTITIIWFMAVVTDGMRESQDVIIRTVVAKGDHDLKEARELQDLAGFVHLSSPCVSALDIPITKELVFNVALFVPTALTVVSLLY